MIVSMAWGVLAGGALQLLWQFPVHGAARVSSSARAWTGAIPDLRQIARLMGPAILGNAALQINMVVNSNLASGITGRGRPRDQRAGELAGLRVPLPAAAGGYFWRGHRVGHSAGDFAQRRPAANGRIPRPCWRARLGTTLLLTIPSSVGLAVMGESMIGAVYQGGQFTAYDTHQTALALTCSASGWRDIRLSRCWRRPFTRWTTRARRCW